MLSLTLAGNWLALAAAPARLTAVLAVDWNELFLDIVLPETDRLVAIQWMIMGPIWLFVVGLSWQYEKDIRHFMWGLCMANLAWFMFRLSH